MIVVLIVAAAVLLVTPVVLYPVYTGVRARQWDRAMDRDEQGRLKGTDHYEVGDGDIALLMIHGFASSPAVFQKMAPALARHGFRCRVIRLPGFGQPVGNPDFQLAAWRKVVDDEVKELRQSSRQVWLVGHSMGGTLALDCVLRKGEVEGVVLLTPLIEVARARSVLLPPRRWFELGRKVWPEGALIETAFPVDIHEPMPGLDEMRDLYLPLAAYAEMFALVDQVANRAGDVACPVLMAVAPADLVVDSKASTTYFSRLGAERKQLLVMPKSGHVLPLDRGWDVVVAAMENFVRN